MWYLTARTSQCSRSPYTNFDSESMLKIQEGTSCVFSADGNFDRRGKKINQQWKRKKRREGNEEESRRETKMEEKTLRCLGDIIFSAHCLSTIFFSVCLSPSLSVCLSHPHSLSVHPSSLTMSFSLFLSLFLLFKTLHPSFCLRKIYDDYHPRQL